MNIIATYELLQEISPETNTLTYVDFGSLICMLLEEWCKHNEEDIVEFIGIMKDMIVQVNAEQGRY